MKDTRKGFTLVELLAVIVILAIIMIIAIPSVLGTMTTARQKSFCEYVSKVYQAGQNQYLTEVNNGSFTGQQISNGGKTYIVYDVKTQLGLSSTGNYDGYVAIRKATKDNGNKTQVYVFLFDAEYVTTSAANTVGWIEYTSIGEPLPDHLMDKPTTFTKDTYKTQAYIEAARKTADATTAAATTTTTVAP